MLTTLQRQFTVILFVFSILHSLFFILHSAHAAPAAVPKTGQTTSYATRDDGDLERGVAWPGQRFSDNGNGTVTDNLTGLIWLKNANCTDSSGGISKTNGYLTWANALTWSNNLASGKCGLSDGSSSGQWRLPNVDELESLVDLQRYNPALPTGHPFSNAQAYFYWSSSSYAYHTSYAWFVHMNDGLVSSSSKTYNDYVWPVRSRQSGALGSLNIYDTNGNALGTQAAGVPFTIRVTGYSSSGAGITGWLYLSASPSVISKSSVWLTNGVGTASVSLDTVGTAQIITASYQGIRGTSAAFDVTGSGVSQSRLSGIVTDGNGNRVAGATVALNNATTCLQSVSSDSNGFYSFTSAPPGKAFFVQATTTSGARSGQLTVDLSNRKPVTMDLVVKPNNCNPDGLTPILLVPGIMGSSYYNAGMYPLLPKGQPEADYAKWGNGSWGLHDPFKAAGWRDFINELGNHGYSINNCTILPVPYDWRKPIDDISHDYLEMAIERAKREAGTQKVNIIAHSMGGLVTRSYIDNHSNNDIDRFAMVGTPNHGSANAYYLWEGGDPRTLDDKTKSSYFSIDRDLKFYENTITLNYEYMKNATLWFYSKSKIRDFIHGDVKSAKQLLPTYTFLVNDSHSFGLQEEQNTWLKDLNSATNDSAYFASKGVTATLRSGDNTETISMVKVGDPNSSYVDGVPKSTYKLSSGDGTVLQTSVDLPGLSPVSTTGTHASLIEKFNNQLITFMTYPVAGASARLSSTATAESSLGTPIGPTLGILVLGRVSPLLVDPTGKKAGINLTTGLQENEITGASVTADQESAGISMENVADGVYTLTVGGEETEDSWLTVSYMAADANVERKLHHFSHAAPVSFTITVNAAAPERITISRLPDMPTNLQADAIGTTSLVTKLSWSAVATPGVTGYNVYSRRDDEPFLTQVGTTSATTYTTTDSWAINDTVVSHLYAVTAIKADGSESFLSNMAENNDRDHDGLTDAEELALGTNPALADTDGDGYSDFLEQQHGSNPLVATSVPTVTLGITKGGDGGGDVTVTTNGATCGVTCETTFNLNSPVVMTATPDNLSTFGSWTGCNSIGAGGECNVTMSDSKGVDASFVLAPKARIGLSGYSLLTDAYTAAGTTAEIWTLTDVFTGPTTLDQVKTITLKGGWNAAYLATSGYTVIKGKVTIKKGSLRVKRLKVRPL